MTVFFDFNGVIVGLFRLRAEVMVRMDQNDENNDGDKGDMGAARRS